ncbi:hypothetical protein NLU13_8443 [Sarocladium strictum]|uniref:tRNA (guanine(9)-N1)-methyltransferase n=1 Tax=Sarocladium strictum TaxID=5046 RepID=A0AA39GC68_SARSR|nr:hypothetical protein NLU13_8443 [Sarocladium strictum]
MEGVVEGPQPPAQPSAANPESAPTIKPLPSDDPSAPLSKNALKRMRKRQAWEEGRQDRAKKRKEKRHESKIRKRTQRRELISQGIDPNSLAPKREPSVLVPIALVLDCDFEQYMLDKERISLASQITRSYSDNQKARYKSHFWVDGWRGKLKDRFETVLGNQHANWRGVGFEEGDFLQAAVKAREAMKTKGGEVIPALQPNPDKPVLTREETTDEASSDPPLDPAYSDVIYLSSDSPYTLQRLEANTTYVIGGLVDKNREKGLCHRRATDKGIRTARLPIGDFMVMRSRQVLATNHVVEIMLKWLECEDWGEAFMSVIPKRKGGVLRGAAAQEQSEGGPEEEGEDENEGDDGEADGPVEGAEGAEVTAENKETSEVERPVERS